MKPWSSLPPNMTTTARGLRVSITSRTCVNQLKTSGRSRPLAMRPSIASTASIARLPAIARSTDSPGTTTSESPAIQMRSFFARRELLALRRVGRCRDGRGRLRLRCRDRRVDLVVVRAAERRLQRAAAGGRGEARRHALEGPGHAERDVALPALGLDRRRLVQPGRVQEEGDEEPGERDDDRRPRRVQAASALGRARTWSPPGSLVRLHQNWK